MFSNANCKLTPNINVGLVRPTNKGSDLIVPDIELLNSKNLLSYYLILRDSNASKSNLYLLITIKIVLCIKRNPEDTIKQQNQLRENKLI